MGTKSRYLNLITLDDMKIVPNGHTVPASLVINFKLKENSSEWAHSASNNTYKNILLS